MKLSDKRSWVWHIIGAFYLALLQLCLEWALIEQGVRVLRAVK